MAEVLLGTIVIDSEQSLGRKDFKGGTAHNTSRNKIHVTHTMQNSHINITSFASMYCI
jgi:hypothetical protein